VRFLDISEIISELSRHERIPNSLETKKLLIQLAMWMRFPISPDTQRAAVFYASAVYAKQKWGDIDLESLPERKRKFILRGFRVSDILHDQYDLVAPDFVMSEYVTPFYPLNEFEYIANILKFIFWYDPKKNRFHDPNAREVASLNKAFLFMVLHGFGKRMVMTKTTFMQQWHSFHAASPFHYVDIFEFNGRFRLNPNDEWFVKALDALAADSEGIREFLQKCRSAVEKLRERLHKKATESMTLPNFPDGCPCSPLSPIELPDEVRKLVQSKDFEYDPNKNKQYFSRLYEEVYGEA